MSEKIVSYSKDKIARILANLDELVVSMDRIGSYWATRNSDEEYYEIENRFLTDWNVSRKLAEARKILSEAFSSELGQDGLDELERNAASNKYWTLSTALDSRDKYKFLFVHNDIDLTNFKNTSWEDAPFLIIDKSWMGDIVRGRTFCFRGLWSDNALYAQFECVQNEPFMVSGSPVVDAKTIGLWERDVWEIFIAPDKNEPRRYFEFEVAPTGEWLDLALDLTSGERATDWDYNSGMETAARIEGGKVTMAMKIPWEAFGKKPEIGDVWLGNIFRCVGKEPDRGYLAWRPTMTEKPNFHVPEAFGEFHFA